MYTMEYYLATEKKETMPFVATWMSLEIVILSEVSQTEKVKYHITYMWDLKNDTNKLIYKTETDSRRKQIYDYQGERGSERDKLGGWDFADTNC